MPRTTADQTSAAISRQGSGDRVLARRLNREIGEQSGEIEHDSDRLGYRAQDQRAAILGAPGGGRFERREAGARKVVDQAEIDDQPAIAPGDRLIQGPPQAVRRGAAQPARECQHQNAVAPFLRDTKWPDQTAIALSRLNPRK